MCKCGCNTCETKIKGPLLTEGKVKSLLSEGLQYHIDKKIPLFETVYRIGSDKHLALIKEARKMYSRNVINLCEDDEALIKTNLGEFALYEGESVPLDLPMVNESDNMSMNEDKIDREKIEGILWNLKNSNKLSNPSDPKKKEALIKKLEKQLSRLKENMYIDDEEFEMEMGRSKKDSLKKEMMMHVDQLMDGNIDMIDFMNVVEEIMLDVKIAAKDEELNKRKNNG